MNTGFKRFSNRALLFVVCIVLCMSSCMHKRSVAVYDWPIDSIKNELASNPSQVTAFYDSMMTVIGSASDRHSRELQLFLILAKVRNDESGLNDSLTRILAKEFATSDSYHQSVAHFVNGRALMEVGATEAALREFCKAKSITNIEKHPIQYVRICVSMSTLYSNKGLYSLALDLKFEALKYMKQANDTAYLSHSYRDIADTYEFQGNNDSASLFFQKAIYYGKLSGAERAIDYCNHDYVRFLLRKDSLFKAKKIMDLQPAPESAVFMSYHANRARYYYRVQDYDSCIHHCRLLTTDSSPLGRLTAYGQLYECYKDINNDKRALESLEHYTNLNDSIFDVQKVKEIRKIRNKYDYLLAKKQKVAEEKHFVFLVCSIVLVALLIVVILYSFIQRQKLHNLKRIEIMKARLKLRQLRYEKSAESLEDRKQEVESLKHQLEDMMNKESSTDLELTKVRKQLAELTVRLKSIEKTSSEMEDKSFRESSAYRKIVDAINNQEYAELELEDWKAFQSGCQKAYPNLFAAVSEFSFSMSADELKICYLTKLGVGPTEISRLIFKTPSAVSKIKVRTYSKLMNKNGKTADFDALIHSL